MDYISQEVFLSANIIENTEKLFIQLWSELFNPDTIDSYRVRVMNALLILNELEEVINDYLKEITPHLTNVIYVAKETERILSRDFICQKHFKNETDFAIKYIKSIWDKPKKEDLFQHYSKVKILKEKLSAEYFKLLIEEIDTAIFITKDIEILQKCTKALATQLVQRGYSFKYLFERKFLFLDSKDHLSFKDKFELFKNDIQKQNKYFRVLFKFSAVNSLLKFSEIISIKITNKINIATKVEEIRFVQQPGTFYGELKVEAPDPDSSVFLCRKSISLLQNIVRFEYRSSEFKISPFFLVYDEIENSVHLNSSLQRSLGFISAGKDSRFKKYLESFDKLRDNHNRKIDGDSVDRIINSFHYFRLSLDSAEPETRFLLNWIAFEYLVKINLNKGLIEKVVNYIPKLFVCQYIDKLLKDFSSNLLRLRCDRKILSSIGIQINASNKFDLASLFEALRDETKVSAIISSNKSPLFEMRVRELSKIMIDSERITAKLNEHFEDIQWNLQRIYRVRNKIVHSASTNMNLTQLDGNLTYYYTTLLNNIIYNSINAVSETTLDLIYLRFESVYEFLIYQLKNNNINSSIFFEF